MSRVELETLWRDRIAAADASRVADLVAATGFFRHEEIEIAVELVREAQEHGDDSGYSFVFADGSDGLDAYACYGRTPGTVHSWDLYWIAVAPRVQRAGLGSRLLAEVERRIRRTGAASVWVDTSGRAQYRPTRDFYRRQGFQEAARLRDFYDIGDDKLILVKRLPEPSVGDSAELPVRSQRLPASPRAESFGEI